jgi:hypothetical protein
VVDSGGADSMLQLEGRRRDNVLPKDEAEGVSSSWLHGKEVWHDTAAW